jgi:hypothetical protein
MVADDQGRQHQAGVSGALQGQPGKSWHRKKPIAAARPKTRSGEARNATSPGTWKPRERVPRERV